MIVCPNCNHQNPEGSIQCESCYTPLPSTAPCPNCGASVQTDATFCGQCGFNLEAEQVAKQDEWAMNPFSMIEEDQENLSQENTIPTAVGTSPIVSPWDQDTEDITLGEAISFDDTEIMNPSESASVSETSWELELPQTEKMPWENSDLELNAEIPELLDVNVSDLEIPELPELNLELSEEDVVEEIPELPELNLDITEDNVAEEVSELPELNLELSEEDVAEEVPELPELNLDITEEEAEEVIESISDSSELDLDIAEAEVTEPISDSSELDLDIEEEAVIESISDSSELDLDIEAAAAVIESISDSSELDLDIEAAAAVTEPISDSSELDLDIAEEEEVIESISDSSELDLDIEEEAVTEPISDFSELDLDIADTELEVASASEVTETSSATQLQIQQACLFHVQSSTTLEIPQDLDLIHIGKPNSQIPPDIDVSGFPNADIVSRIHADIRVEGDTYFIEDVGSSNGTYVNHIPLLRGNRYRIRTGDRIALGKGDLVTFIFQIK